MARTWMLIMKSNSKTFPFGQSFRREQSTKWRKKRAFFGWFFYWLIMFVRLVGSVQIEHLIAWSGNVFFQFFSALSWFQFCLQSGQPQLMGWEILLIFNCPTFKTIFIVKNECRVILKELKHFTSQWRKLVKKSVKLDRSTLHPQCLKLG